MPVPDPDLVAVMARNVFQKVHPASKWPKQPPRIKERWRAAIEATIRERHNDLERALGMARILTAIAELQLRVQTLERSGRVYNKPRELAKRAGS
jgi:hypothetical protein